MAGEVGPALAFSWARWQVVPMHAAPCFWPVSCGSARRHTIRWMCAAGELGPALAFSWARWQVVPLCCAAALAGYLAVMCVLALIQHHGATVAECVKSMRKVLQVGLPCPWEAAQSLQLLCQGCGPSAQSETALLAVL